MKQTARDNSLQIQGQNVNVGMSYADVKDLCTTLIRSELASYEQKATLVAQKRFELILDKLLDALANIDERYRIRFQEPAIQFATNETFKEYIRSGNIELSDALIDLMIERLKVEEHTSKQYLIDEARQILPKLSSSAVALLSILTYSKLVFFDDRVSFVNRVKQLSPLLCDLSNISDLDIAYLEQIRCGQRLSFVKTNKGFPEQMRSNYPLLFVKPMFKDDLFKIIQDELNHYTQDVLAKLLSIFIIEGDRVWPNVVSLKEDNIKEEKASEIWTCFQVIRKHYQNLSSDEICQLFTAIDSKWQSVMKLFSRKEVQSFIVSPVGYYIGTRKLSVLCGEEVPLTVFYQEQM